MTQGDDIWRPSAIFLKKNKKQSMFLFLGHPDKQKIKKKSKYVLSECCQLSVKNNVFSTLRVGLLCWLYLSLFSDFMLQFEM